jgi:hypothetical protein
MYISLTPHSEVVRECSVCNPLLRAIYDPKLLVLGLFCYSLQTCDIAAREGFGNGEADKLLASKNIRNEARLELIRAEVQ